MKKNFIIISYGEIGWYIPGKTARFHGHSADIEVKRGPPVQVDDNITCYPRRRPGDILNGTDFPLFSSIV